MPPDKQPEPSDSQGLLRELLQYSRGRLKLYLGYAPGVGKTTRMLRDAQQLHQRGVDLVVGMVETHGRPEMTQLLSGLEVIPLRSISYQGTIQTDLDLEAILKRRPATVLIDELAHTNAPGSLHRKRFEDVEALLDAGISVISALNIQHLERVAETAGRLIGIPVHEVVPDRFLKQADEVQLVDASPETVLERLAQNEVPTGSPFLRRSTLVYLRELALRTVAEVVDADMLARQSGVSSPAGIRERLLVAVSTSPASTRLIRRGARIAEYLDAELFIVFVEHGRPTDEKQRRILQEHEQLSQQIGGQFVRLQGTNIAKTLIAFALEKSITQVIVGESLRSPLEELVRGSIVNTLLRSTNNLDVLVVGETESVSNLSPQPLPLPPRTCFLPTSQERSDRGFGRHKIYLGAAPGVGKTYTMLQEAHDLVAAGVDVVCGIIETHGRAETAALVEGLEVVPKRSIVYQGRIFQELDREAVLARRPAVVLIDELAHTNVPGIDTTKRYQDVEILLAAGIEVISTLNIQHLESLNTLVERTTGVKVRETLPDLLVGCADEVVLIDLSTGELTQRLREGKIYAPAKVEQALSNFFRAENLIALRELALRELADDCTADKLTVRTDECVMVCVNLRPNARQLIRRGARIARRMGARLVVVYIHLARESLSATKGERMREELDRLRQLSIELEGIFMEQSASDVAAQIVLLTHEQSVTLLLLGEPRRSCWEEVLHGSVIEQVLRRSRNLDTLIVGNFERGD